MASSKAPEMDGVLSFGAAPRFLGKVSKNVPPEHIVGTRVTLPTSGTVFQGVIPLFPIQKS